MLSSRHPRSTGSAADAALSPLVAVVGLQEVSPTGSRPLCDARDGSKPHRATLPQAWIEALPSWLTFEAMMAQPASLQRTTCTVMQHMSRATRSASRLSRHAWRRVSYVTRCTALSLVGWPRLICLSLLPRLVLGTMTCNTVHSV